MEMERETQLTISVEQAAERLAISRGHAYALARAGRLPGVLRLGGVYRVSVPAFNEALGIAHTEPENR